jgi:multiple sugar transport system substrate-binding protein
MLAKNVTRRQFLKQAAMAGAAIAGASALGACQAAQQGVAPENAAGKIVWYMNIDQSRNDWANNVIIPEFKKVEPDIEVELMTVPWEEFDAKLLSLSAAGTPPDVFAQWGQSGGGTYVKKGLLRPIDDYVAAAKWDLSNVAPATKEAYKFNGKLYGIPMYVLGTFIYYNKDLFDQAGVAYPPVDWDDNSWTWDEMISRAQTITKDPDDPEKGIFGFANGTNDLYVGIPWLFGAEPFVKEDYMKGEVSEVQLNTAEYIEAAQAKADLTNVLKVAPTASTMDAISQTGNPIAAGRLAMLLGGGWVTWELSPLKDLRWGIAALPEGKARKAATFSDPWYIATKSKNPDAAFQLVDYLTVGEGQNSIATDLAVAPSDMSKLDLWYSSIPQISPEELEKVHKGLLAHGQETPASLLYGYGAVEDVYNQLMSPVWTGEKTAAEVLPEVEKQANEAVKKLSQ